MKRVVISGAGLCGSLLGIVLSKKGYSVTMLEKRQDLRKGHVETGRSINLALSSRGIEALKLADVTDSVKNISIPMYARALHLADGTYHMVNYSGRSGEYINSISRTGLNALLLDRFEEINQKGLHFDSLANKFDSTDNKVRFLKDGTEELLEYDYLFGCDGASSLIRKELFNIPYLSYQFEQQFLDYGYKELHIAPGQGGSFALEKNALHIWPRGQFMMIALPNLDGSFTVTLFLPLEGKDSFKEIDTNLGIKAYFDLHFKDCAHLFDNLEVQYANNPLGALGTIKCSTWTNHKNVLLMGDAAHAILPFYGQGMNCAFEDVSVLNQLINQKGDLSPDLLAGFNADRKQNTDAIADLAYDNFIEMRDLTADPVFLLKRKVETALESKYADYFSKYSMVTFRPDLTYHQAMTMGRQQDEILMKLCQNLDPEIQLNEFYEATKV